MSKVLYIFEPRVEFSDIDINSVFLTQKLIDDNDFPPVCHTSVGDLSPTTILEIAKQFDVIKFIDQEFDTTSNLYYETKCLLNYLSHRMPVENLALDSKNTFCEFDQMMLTKDSPSLWVFGCSHSHGTGLADQKQGYPYLLSRQLNLPLNLIAKPGASINWSFRHLMAADFSKQDIVVWQLTSPDRLSRFDGHNVWDIMLAESTDRCLVDVNNDEQLFFDYFTLLDAGVKYLRSTGIEFYMIGILPHQQYFYRYLDKFTTYPEFCHVPNVYLDVAEDQLHPGPLSHCALAQVLYNHVKCNHD